MSLAIALESGCSSARPAITSLWNQVPPVRWPNKGHDSNGVAVTTEPVAEPAMAANVALQTKPIGESESGGAAMSENDRSNSATMQRGGRLNRADSRSRDGALNSYLSGTEESSADVLVESQRVDSSMERLTAALTDDAIQSQALPQKSLTTLDAKIRVDSLISRTRQLLDIGQLDQARQSAQSAQELGESAQLDYSPDEDRPIDLLRRIEGQLEATRPTEAPRSGNDTAKSPADGSEPEKSTPVTKSTKPSGPLGKETSGLGRIRRDWSTLFRREKRSTGSDGDLIAGEPRLSKPAPAAELRTGRTGDQGTLSGDMQASHSSESGSREAIVMANRSVSLAPPESMVSASAVDLPAISDHSLGEPDSMRSLAPPQMDSEILGARDSSNSRASLPSDPSKSGVETDDGAGQPEFEVVDAVIPFQEVESSTDQPPRREVVDNTEIDQSDWTYLYAIFGVCGLFALGCYRRGAT